MGVPIRTNRRVRVDQGKEFSAAVCVCVCLCVCVENGHQGLRLMIRFSNISSNVQIIALGLAT